MVQKNPANLLRLVVYPNIYCVLYIQGGCLGFLYHQLRIKWFAGFQKHQQLKVLSLMASNASTNYVSHLGQGVKVWHRCSNLHWNWKNVFVNLTLTQQLLGWIEVWQQTTPNCWSDTSTLYITIQVFIKETSFTRCESITTWHQDNREVTEHGGCSKAIQPSMTATIAKVCLVSCNEWVPIWSPPHKSWVPRLCPEP